MSEELVERLVVFQQKEIRRKLHGGEWWYVITDVVAVLTDSVNPADYLKKLRKRDAELGTLFDGVDKGGGQIDPPLRLALILLAASRD